MRYSALAGLTLLAAGLASHALASPLGDPTRLGSGSPVIVHLFEWRWDDIATECETHLGPAGIDAVQVSPPNEHIALDGVDGAWWARYQPVSYALTSRSGDRAAFQQMIERCEAAGVGILVDAVINHMAGIGEGVGIAGTPYTPFRYGDLYTRDEDFNHCGRHEDDQIRDYQDRHEVQHCHLLGLADLATGTESVRERIADYLQGLLEMGVAGFRIDAAKHMPAEDIGAILERLEGEPYVFQEVIDPGNEPIEAGEYLTNAAVTEFGYSHHLATAIESGDLASLETLGQGKGWVESDSALVFVDNHDKQRGHVGGGVLMHRDDYYRLALTFMLAWPYGTPKLMSSYTFDDGDQGPPSVAEEGWRTLPVHGDEGLGCLDEGVVDTRGWVCEHRWPLVTAMVDFRQAMGDAPVTHWQQAGASRIAFARGGRGFVALNRSDETWKAELVTGLPAGEYCNLLDGCVTRVSVDDDGWSEAEVPRDGAVVLSAERPAP
ncbi:alpha-amylase [Halomonas heilongjiangensis]|uniref:Alpha-amylase n=1 Tax=Halomonas heilongjiangensis TaxID=1387883 RepID=A0A2N7TJQ4_9GAMM|nr:alpha-amylase family protein [Halomonas heilongjiangensis]PMR68407.1 ATPase [Halomonas heilongjiangensis]PXX87182.1 ATPase [Halomonas heilongjiangensis]